MSELIKIGEIVGVHGIKGEVKVLPTSDFPERFLKLTQVTLRSTKGLHNVPVSAVRSHKGSYILTLDGVSDRNAAEALRGHELVVTPDQVPKLPPGEWYLWQIVGCEVYNSLDGLLLGQVVEVLQPPANDVYVVASGGKTIYIPAIRDVVKKVDILNRRIEIIPLAGLLE